MLPLVRLQRPVHMLLVVMACTREVVGGACQIDTFESAIAAAATSSPMNASAQAEAFLQACKGKWSRFDAKKYFQNNWHPGSPAGSGCDQLSRIGRSGDGGKTVCGIRQLLHTSQECQVISIGSNGEPSFETAIHAIAPHCKIDTFDGTLNGTRQRLRSNLPEFVNFIAENANSETWQRYSNRMLGGGGHISVLKMDCEGCEFETLPPFVDNVCIDQILLELHACGGTLGSVGVNVERRVRRAHELLLRLDRTHSIFNAEPNIAYGDGTCIEYSFTRRVPCSMPLPRAGMPVL
jgi:hypothetical protein